jgi:hypothetical protein
VAVDVGDEGEGQPLHRSAGGHGQLREAVAAAPHLWSRVVKLGLDLEDAGVGVVDDGRASGGLQADEQRRQPKSWWLWFDAVVESRGRTPRRGRLTGGGAEHGRRRPGEQAAAVARERGVARGI